MKKYTVETEMVTNCSINHSYEVDTIEEVEELIEDYKMAYNGLAKVYDNNRNEFIYIKRTMFWNPEIDKLGNINRDLRTKTLTWKA